MEVLYIIIWFAILFAFGFEQAMIFEGKKWESFKWDEHYFLIIKLGLIVIMALLSSAFTTKELFHFFVLIICSRALIHNGAYYQTRKWIDQDKINEIEYPKGFFDMTKTPYILSFTIRIKKWKLPIRLQLSWSFPVRVILFIIGIIVYILMR